MEWESASAFFAMGGYGLYVWGSFGVCLVAMIAEPLLVLKQRQQVIRQIQQNND